MYMYSQHLSSFFASLESNIQDTDQESQFTQSLPSSISVLNTLIY